jgi:hypothetical protein
MSSYRRGTIYSGGVVEHVDQESTNPAGKAVPVKVLLKGTLEGKEEEQLPPHFLWSFVLRRNVCRDLTGHRPGFPAMC